MGLGNRERLRFPSAPTQRSIKRMIKSGRRNISLLTQAPTGSVSILSKCGDFDTYNVSSGIEPVFRNSYIRRKKINPNDQNVSIDFTDALGDVWQEHKVFHSNVTNYNNGRETDKLPGFFVTSDEISWEKRVELQAAEQQYIDYSISSTINLPEGTSEEVVGNIYLSAWKKGLKGVTVYVDGCRSGVLVSTDEKDSSGRPKQIVHSQAPKRPEELPCEIHHATINKERWTLLVGMLEGQPYEIFTGYSEDLSIPNKCKAGKIVKIRSGYYNLHVDIGGEEFIIKNMSNKFVNPDSSWATRVVSAALRHGTPVDFLVEILNKTGDMNDINKVVARLLKKFIKDGQKVRSNQVCPECNSSNLIYEEGCLRCLDCGNAKCG